MKVAQYSTTRQIVVTSWGEREAYYHAIDIIHDHTIVINLSNELVDCVTQTVATRGV